ncbi:CHAP domain-containing protein [Cryobacterium melibiosiphilum]|uniref:CHAP domain-containing protein n=1 Tax=Cryobacterium melibiosiphilum TaxID=995039 RepID=A0A3A5MUF8_9MICO|nr:amidase domain-containing protein [Cryobacterium melibiosiphilum]RJT91449.1 CHAP domain-containing protein [Cryobacterium melibiosiphilum]
MALNRWQLTGLGLVVVASVTVAGVALATAGTARTPNPMATTDAAATPEPTATREVPAETAAPVEVEVDPAVQAQLDYVLAHWADGTYNSAEYGVVGENDCVNFASQALIERGWQMDDVWNNPKTGNAYDASSAWISSTALMNYIADTGRATALTDDQRDQVKVGDVAQFDWDNSGDRDHTGIVTRVEGTGDDIVISFAGHTLDSDYRSVDTAITTDHPGATAYYWSIP